MVKGVIGTTGHIEVRAMNTLSIVSPFSFLNLINALCSYKRVFLGDGTVKYLGAKDHTV